MQVIDSLTQILQTRCPTVHKTRLAALLTNVTSLIHGKTLTVTGLGRNSHRPISAKHAIKQSDRLVGNAHLQNEQVSLYRAVVHCLISKHSRPLITVDWSDYTHDRRWIFLRASIPVGGRALTLYEEVHPLVYYGNSAIQKQFLKTLKSLFPQGVRPVLVTDAGFIGPWFRDVLALGWDYVGRIRKNLLYRDDPEGEWDRCVCLYPKATRRPTYYGVIQLAKRNPLTCHLHIYRDTPKGRHKRTPAGKCSQRKVSNANALRESSPWLIVTSLSSDDYPSARVMQCYRTRMQIEQAFRDMKNTRAGLCLRQTRSRSKERLANLLLIGMLATFCIWLVGRLAEKQKQHYQFQANTVKNERVLSLFFLGLQCLKRGSVRWCHQHFKETVRLLHEDIKCQSII
ncbi:MAG: IS4 family transposase [Haliea sp.]